MNTMTSLVKIFSVFLLSCVFVSHVKSAPQTNNQRNSADYSVTHLDIRDAILSLVSVLRDQMDKLERHEVRERQLGEQLTRSLATLEKRGRGEEKNIENIAAYVARIDEKIKFVQQTLEKQSEEKRLDRDRTHADMEHLRQSFSQSSGGNPNVERKLDALTDRVNELRTSGESNSGKFDSLMELWKATSSGGSAGSASDFNESIMSEFAEIKETLSRTLELENQLLNKADGGGQTRNEWQTEIVESLDSQRKQLAVLEEEVGKSIGFLSDVSKSTSKLSGVLAGLDEDMNKGFQSLDLGVKSLQTDSSGYVGEKLHTIQDLVERGQRQLENQVLLTEQAVQNLSILVESEHDHLSSELKGLANVESVLLDTGDSVLDTKRRLEYGVQQIMGEINHQLATYTGNLNASIQLRFDGMATAVLGNQSIALTNLTSRMEEEISQVWRQIGILYHQMSRSANILDEIHSQTSQYVNNSMDTMSSMDGKVGQITNQMGEVDDNLNYLLGRMSLVVQEFNMIKGGLGEALVNLKESFEEIGDLDKKADVTVPPQTSPNAQDSENEISVVN